MGVSSGMLTSTSVVDASSRSLGTRNVRAAYPPFGASPGLTLAWAAALGAATTSTPAATAATRIIRRSLTGFLLMCPWARVGRLPRLEPQLVGSCDRGASGQPDDHR